MEDEDKVAEQLNELLHGLVGYDTKKDGVHAWHSIPISKIQLALDCVLKFQVMHTTNFIGEKCQKAKFDKFIASSSNSESIFVQVN